MGRYIVNGEVIDVPGDRPTAKDLKAAAEAVESDWVMASMPGGAVEHVQDVEVLPPDAERFRVVPKYRYGAVAREDE